MNIWLINQYGMPVDCDWARSRFHFIARSLHQAGHQVTWFTSNFWHVGKCHFGENQTEVPAEDYRQVLVPVPGYRKNNGLDRLWFEFVFAWRILRLTRGRERPDLIIAGHSQLWTGPSVVHIAHRNNAKLIFDLIDVWPEIFPPSIPAFLRVGTSLIIRTLKKLRSRVLSHAQAIIGTGKRNVAVARGASPDEGKLYEVIYEGADLNYVQRILTSSPSAAHRSLAPTKLDKQIWAVYSGSLSVGFDMEAVLGAAALLRDTIPQLVFIIAGDGTRMAEVRKRVEADGLSNVRLLGRLSYEDVIRLLGICDIGLSTYVRDSTIAIPRKVFDYWAVGLPIINSLRSELETILLEEKAGLQYFAHGSQSLAAALGCLCNDNELRDRTRDNARRLAESMGGQIDYAKIVRLAEQLCRDKSRTREDCYVTGNSETVARN